MDKIYSNFGPLTTYTDSAHARDVLDMFRDMARMKEAQVSPAAPSSGKPGSTSKLAEQAKGWMASGKTYLISVGGQHYDELEPSDQLKVLNYFINRLSSTNILSNREDALRWAFRSMPNVFGVNRGEHAVQMGITILKEEAGKLQGSAAASAAAVSSSPAAGTGAGADDGSGLGSTGLTKSLIYAAQLLFQAGLLKKGDISTINNDPYGNGMKLIMDAIARGLASKSQMQREAAEMAQEIISSIRQQAAAGGASGASAGTAGGAGAAGAAAAGKGSAGGGAGGTAVGGGFMALIGQGLQAIIDMLKGMPNSPKAADQVLLEMALATEPKYWFPTGQVAENGFYGPYIAADGKYWAEVDYDGQTNQFVFSGRYTVIPNDAVKAIQQAAAQGG